MLNSAFHIEPVRTSRPADVDYRHERRPIPATQDLELPHASRHGAALADMTFDPVALVWVKNPKPAPRADEPPPVTPVPRNTGGDAFEVRARGVRFWTITAHSFDLAWAEVERLCEASGYDTRDVVLQMQRAEPVCAPISRKPVVSRDEVRRRLGL